MAGHSSLHSRARDNIGSRATSKLRALLLVLALSMMCGSRVSYADYKLDSGDVVEFSVVGRNELQRRATVNSDGNIILPLIGEVRAAGMSLSNLRAQIANLFAPGQSIRANDILVDLIEIRPFYVAGDVMKPGAYPFRSGITAVHAIALAGGTTRQTGDNAVYAIELNSRLATLRLEYVKQSLRIARLSAELAGGTAVDTGDVANVIPQSTINSVANLESQALRALEADREQERQYLNKAISLASAQILALENGLKEDTDGTQQQIAEVQRVADLNRKGLSNTARVAEEQRASSLLKSRQMDTGARLARARQDKEELIRKLQKVDDRQLRVPKELQDAVVTQDGIRRQLDTLVSTAELDGVPIDQDDSPPQLKILKLTDGTAKWVAAAEETVIQPGDLLKVTKTAPAGLGAEKRSRP